MKFEKPEKAYKDVHKYTKRKRRKKSHEYNKTIDTNEQALYNDLHKKYSSLNKNGKKRSDAESAKIRSKAKGKLTGKLLNSLLKEGIIVGVSSYEKIRKWQTTELREPSDIFVEIDMDVSGENENRKKLKKDLEPLNEILRYLKKKEENELIEEIKLEIKEIKEHIKQYPKKKREKNWLYFSSNIFILISKYYSSMHQSNEFKGSGVCGEIEPLTLFGDYGQQQNCFIATFLNQIKPNSPENAILLAYYEKATDSKSNEHKSFGNLKTQTKLASTQATVVHVKVNQNKKIICTTTTTYFNNNAKNEVIRKSLAEVIIILGQTDDSMEFPIQEKILNMFEYDTFWTYIHT
jgi:hypothetical protein